jgi:hypothetical protein
MEDWQAVISPKVQGAINLHEALANEALDFFICLSSLAATVGNYGQSSYAGSNAFLDSFCQWRSSKGLPSASIALPSISDVGYLAKMVESNPAALQSNYLSIFAMTAEQIGHLIKSMLASQKLESHVVAGISRRPDLAEHGRLQDPLLSHLQSNMRRKFTGAGGTAESSLGITETASPSIDRQFLSRVTDIEEAFKIVYLALTKKIAKDMMISPQDITLDSSLSQIGLDSLVAVEFRNWLAKELDANIRVIEIIKSKSIRQLVVTVVQQSSLLTRLHMNGDNKVKNTVPE